MTPDVLSVYQHYKNKDVSLLKSYTPLRSRYGLYFRNFYNYILSKYFAGYNIAFLSRARVLDYGCGNGHTIRLMTECGISPSNITGLELYSHRLDEAKRLTAPDVNLISTHDKIAPSSYDFVILSLVLSSCIAEEDFSNVVSDVSRYLKTGGKLIIFDFRYNNPNNQSVRGVNYSKIYNAFSKGFSIKSYAPIFLAPQIVSTFGRVLGRFVIILSIIPCLNSHYVSILEKTGASVE